MTKLSLSKKMLFLVLGLGLSLGLSLGTGPIHWNAPNFSSILLDLRLPRTLLAAVAGASLSVCGLLCQSTLQNPLADPYLLGISSGASLGAIVSIAVFHTSPSGSWTAAFFGGLSGLALTLGIIGPRRWMAPGMLVLSGAVASFILSAFMLLLITQINHPDLPGLLFWLGGDFSLATWRSVGFAAAALIPALVLAFTRSKQLEILETGEEEARSLGVSTRRLMLTSLATASLAASVTVAHVGIVAFVGLMVPHASRRMFGTRMTVLTLACILLGSTLLVLADWGSRVIPTSGEFPVGAITSLVGSAVLVFLLRRTPS